MDCPKCGQKCMKNGMRHGKQRWRCLKCKPDKPKNKDAPLVLRPPLLRAMRRAMSPEKETDSETVRIQRQLLRDFPEKFNAQFQKEEAAFREARAANAGASPVVEKEQVDESTEALVALCRETLAEWERDKDKIIAGHIKVIAEGV